MKKKGVHVFSYLYVILSLEYYFLAFCENLSVNQYYLGFCKWKVLIIHFYLYHKGFSINSMWLLQNDPKPQQFSVICGKESPAHTLCSPVLGIMEDKKTKIHFLIFFKPITRSLIYKIIICKSCCENIRVFFFLLFKWR